MVGKVAGGLVAFTLLATASGEARADAASPPAAAPVRLETGLELTPFAVSRTRLGVGTHFGVGGMVRPIRYRWTHGYFTPVQVGLFLDEEGPDQATLVQLMAEWGAVLRKGPVAVELGLALGLGMLSIDCSAGCRAGGDGALVSPVVRVLFQGVKPLTLGVVARAQVPLSTSYGEGSGYYGTLLLVGLDVGYGW